MTTHVGLVKMKCRSREIVKFGIRLEMGKPYKWLQSAVLLGCKELLRTDLVSQVYKSEQLPCEQGNLFSGDFLSN